MENYDEPQDDVVAVHGLVFQSEDGEEFTLDSEELVNLCGAAMTGIELTEFARRLGAEIMKTPNVPKDLVDIIERLGNSVADEKLEMARNTIRKIIENVIDDDIIFLPEGKIIRA